jgi:small GTP-binding protein
MSSGEYDYLFKIIVTGDGAVGKTAITIRFSQGKFDSDYKMTIGVDFAIKMLDISDKKVKLQIWDTGGQERFSYIRPLYYKGAMGNVLIFDLTNRTSYDHLEKWYNEVLQNCGEIPMMLVGNKADLPDRAVSKNEAEAWAASHGMQYFETSAKTGTNVGDVFADLAYTLIEGPSEAAAPGAQIISTTPPQTTNIPKTPSTSFTAEPPKPQTPTFTRPVPKPASPGMPRVGAPKPEPVSFKPNIGQPTYQPKPIQPTSPPKPVQPIYQPKPIQPTPAPKPAQPTYQQKPVQPIKAPKPVQPTISPAPEPEAEESLDDVLKMLDIEETDTAAIPIEESEPIEIPEISEPIPIEEPEPIAIEDPAGMISTEEPQPLEISDFSEPIPIETEEEAPLGTQSQEPIPIDFGANQIDISGTQGVQPSTPEMIEEEPIRDQTFQEPSIEEFEPIDITEEPEPIELPSPESILESEGTTPNEIHAEKPSIFGISSSSEQENQPFRPFTSDEPSSMEPNQPISPSEEPGSMDLFTTLSQKSQAYQREKKPSRFVPFIPSEDGEYEDIELEIVMKDEEELASSNMIKCPGCNRDIPADWKFCTYCGTLLK